MEGFLSMRAIASRTVTEPVKFVPEVAKAQIMKLAKAQAEAGNWECSIPLQVLGMEKLEWKDVKQFMKDLNNTLGKAEGSVVYLRDNYGNYGRPAICLKWENKVLCKPKGYYQ
jgi:hypothetical protein